MEKIDEIIKCAKQNNNKITIEMLDNFNIKENEFSEIIDKLKSVGIIIESETLIDDNINCNEEIETDLVTTLINELKTIPMLTREQNLELLKEYANGNLEAKDKIMNGNLRLVLSIAAKYNNTITNKGSGLGLLDFFQEGCIGMDKAINKFDVSKGYQFSTYATWWIRQAISRANMDKSRTIRLPVHEIEFMNRLKKFIIEYSSKNGDAPTYKQMAQHLGVTEAKINQALCCSEDVLSLEHNVNNEDDSTLEDFVADTTDDVYIGLEQKMCYQELHNIIKNRLNEREQYVINHRYGISDGKNWTLEDIGHGLKVTRERVRQIEAKALKKLKLPCKNEFGDDVEIFSKR